MGGLMTDTFEPDSPGRSPEDTYNRLRRVSYAEACVIYTMACMYLRSGASSAEINEAAAPDLKSAGWTINDLMIEARKQERDI